MQVARKIRIVIGTKVHRAGVKSYRCQITDALTGACFAFWGCRRLPSREFGHSEDKTRCFGREEFVYAVLLWLPESQHSTLGDQYSKLLAL